MTNEELCLLARKGDSQAAEELVKQNMGLVRKLAYDIYKRFRVTYSLNEMDTEDLIQEGLMAVFRSAGGYEPDNGNSFTAYAGRAAVNAMLDWLRQKRSDAENTMHLRQECSYDISLLKQSDGSGLDPYRNSPEEIVIKMDQLERLEKAIQLLPKRNQQYLKYRFGLEGGEPHSTAEAGEYFGLTDSKIQKLEEQSLDFLKKELKC